VTFWDLLKGSLSTAEVGRWCRENESIFHSTGWTPLLWACLAFPQWWTPWNHLLVDDLKCGRKFIASVLILWLSISGFWCPWRVLESISENTEMTMLYFLALARFLDIPNLFILAMMAFNKWQWGKLCFGSSVQGGMTKAVENWRFALEAAEVGLVSGSGFS
jgi:hypothetical protein